MRSSLKKHKPSPKIPRDKKYLRGSMGVGNMGKNPAMDRLYELLWENPNWDPKSETGKEIKHLRNYIQGRRDEKLPKLDKIDLKDLTLEEYSELLSLGYLRKDIAAAAGLRENQFTYLNQLRGFGNKYKTRNSN